MAARNRRESTRCGAVRAAAATNRGQAAGHGGLRRSGNAASRAYANATAALPAPPPSTLLLVRDLQPGQVRLEREPDLLALDLHLNALRIAQIRHLFAAGNREARLRRRVRSGDVL